MELRPGPRPHILPLGQLSQAFMELPEASRSQGAPCCCLKSKVNQEMNKFNSKKIKQIKAFENHVEEIPPIQATTLPAD